MLTDEQRALRDAVGTLLDRKSDVRAAIEQPSGHDRALWAWLCEMGVAGLHIPEEFGGAGASLAETCVVAAELGRTLTPAPFLSSVLASSALLAAGATEHLPDIAAGRIATVAVEPYVLDGDLAEILLVTDDDGLFEVPVERVRRTMVPTMDPTRRLATVSWEDAPKRRIGGPEAVRAAVDAALVVLAAEQVGAAAECLRRTVEYTKQRVQFGRPIGSFQALQHRMADLHVLVETARSAAWAAARGDSVDAAVAKIHCSEALSTVAGEMIQLHGGIAITWEHDAHLFFKRAHGSAHLFGSPGTHVTRLAALAGITPGTR
ncbi:MAG TPA: acyl-CoA dehydrogenase family protein [Pseudonocardiaceae bacterium]|nr:acyl-CoA dehydrogenase family protein [Pseudonocardiaceae bacterium]